MSLQAFFSHNAERLENTRVIVSDRFKDEKGKPVPWEIRPLNEEEVDAIRKACTRKEKLKNGNTQSIVDDTAVCRKMVAESVIFPNLKDADLQASYGVMGETKLLSKMLSAGEYANLLFKVQEISGYDKDINELVEEVKN